MHFLLSYITVRIKKDQITKINQIFNSSTNSAICKLKFYLAYNLQINQIKFFRILDSRATFKYL